MSRFVAVERGAVPAHIATALRWGGDRGWDEWSHPARRSVR
jgi:hypothetical protein